MCFAFIGILTETLNAFGLSFGGGSDMRVRCTLGLGVRSVKKEKLRMRKDFV
jgi:hypothetical protein